MDNVRRHTRKSSSWGAVLFTILLLAAALVVAFIIYRHELTSWLADDLIRQEVEREKEPLMGRVSVLEQEIDALRDDLAALSPRLPEDRLLEAFGPEQVQPGIPETVAARCGTLETRLGNLLAYLGNRDYVAAYKLRDDMATHLDGIIRKLISKPPAVVRETDSLLRVLNNSAHFYRVLGKRDTLLLRDILRKEADIAEPMFSLLYDVASAGDGCSRDGLKNLPDTAGLYPYSVFFLNTLGGRSYLFRRDSRLSLLARYYSVLELDRANEESLNEYGLDIRPSLQMLLEDLPANRLLVHQDRYLETLKRLEEKYSGRYGGR